MVYTEKEEYRALTFYSMWRRNRLEYIKNCVHKEDLQSVKYKDRQMRT